MPTSQAAATSRALDLAPPTPRVPILGSQVDLVSVVEVVDRIEGWIAEGSRSCRRIVASGFHGLWKAHQDPAVRQILNTADLWAPDGIAPVWMARLQGHRNVERAPGAEIMREFLRRAHSNGLSSYFYGDSEATLAALRLRIEADFPGHRVAGMYSPPFRALTPEEDQIVIDRINATRPDVLWVALGLPKQDIWIHERLHHLRVPVAVGVGAAFGFLSGAVDRCPDWIGRSGFEWVYRFLKEPRKLWRRDLLEGPRFILSALWEFLKKRRNA
jgi:N-acetylglucosaminyldiphosphoundecaprenol N-acetyl-beta-D-mannosaminyltransferase